MLADLFEIFEFLELEERLVLFHQFCGIEQGAGGSDFLTAGDDVRLGLLLGDEDGVHDVADLARKDNILHTGIDDLDVEVLLAVFQPVQHVRGDLILVFEDLVDRILPDVFAQRELHGNAHLFLEVVDFAGDLDIIGDAVGTDEVDAERDLVFSQDFLTGDVHLGEPDVDEVERDVRRPLPEPVQTRFKEPDKLPIEVKPAALMVRDDDLGEQGRIHLGEHVERDVFGHFRGFHVESAERVLVKDRPEGIPSGTKGIDEQVVYIVERKRSVGDFY